MQLFIFDLIKKILRIHYSVENKLDVKLTSTICILYDIFATHCTFKTLIYDQI